MLELSLISMLYTKINKINQKENKIIGTNSFDYCSYWSDITCSLSAYESFRCFISYPTHQWISLYIYL